MQVQLQREAIPQQAILEQKKANDTLPTTGNATISSVRKRRCRRREAAQRALMHQQNRKKYAGGCIPEISLHTLMRNASICV